MADMQDIFLERKAASPQGSAVIAPLYNTPAMWIRYLGTAASGATVAIASSGDATFTTDGSTADTTVNTTGTIDMSSPAAATNNFAKVAALINASVNWQCYLLAVRPETDTDKGDGDAGAFYTVAKVDLSTAAMKLTGLYLYIDQTIADYTAFCFTGFDPTKSTTEYHDDTNCYSVCQWVHVNVDSSAASYLDFYTANQSTSYKLFSYALTDNTDTNVGSMSVEMPLIQGRFGERLIVIAQNDQTAAADELKCTGYTVDRSGIRDARGLVLTNVTVPA